MSEAERELLRLLSLAIQWPSVAGRREFKTELHLKRAIEKTHTKVFGT